nr:retrovirus-related Pol polyprotein from transposon TNT 1-94 [Tanacetum cinerariifolium]
MASSATAAHSSIFSNALSYLGSKNEDILEISRKDDELVKDYSTRMMDVVNQMRLHGEVLKDHKVMEKMMISVLLNKLQAQEQRVSIRSEEKVEGAFRVSSRSNKGSTSQNTYHDEANCSFKDKPNFNCNFCNKYGHCEKYCRAKKAHNNTQEVQHANVSEEDQWIHKSERSFFINLDTKYNPRVKLGDGRYAPAKERGTITINTKKGTKYISRVSYVPELERSMLSVPKMIKNGYGVNFKKDSWCVITHSRDYKIVILDMVNDRYYLKLDVANASAFSATEDDNMKWHKSIGYLNYTTPKHMNTTKLVRDMPPTSEVDIHESNIEDRNDIVVLKTRPLVDVYESCNSVTKPESYIDASKYSEWIATMNAELQEEIYVKQLKLDTLLSYAKKQEQVPGGGFPGSSMPGGGGVPDDDEVGTLATIESLRKPCIAGFVKPINSTPPPTPPLHHRSPPLTSSSMIVTPSTPNPPSPNPSTTVCRHY